MRLSRRTLLAGLLATPARAADDALRDLARRGAIYLTPASEMYKRRHHDVVERGDKLNQLIRQLAPERGLLSASAWLDLSGEPMFLSLPAMTGRFYSAVLLDPFARVLSEVSRRTAGDGPNALVLVGPAWKGDTPSETRPIYAPSPSMWLRLRLAVSDDDDDVDAARGLQARCLLETPDKRNERRILEMQELMRYRTYAPAEPVADWPEPRPSDPFDLLDRGLAMLAGTTLSAADQKMVEIFEPLRLKPGRRFDVRSFSSSERESIVAGLADAQTQIVERGPNTDDDALKRAWIAKTALAAPTNAEQP